MISNFKNYALSGVNCHYRDETNRRIIVVNLFAAVGMSITFVLGFRALFANEMGLAITLLVASVVFAVSQRLQVRVPTKEARTASISLLISCLMILTLLLIITGGKDNTGPLWIYLVPPVTMFFAGFVRGLLALIAYTVVCALIMFTYNDMLLLTQYSYAFKTRLLYSFLTVSFLSAFYEFSRQKSYDTALYLKEQFERQAKHDHLTQLLNRRGGQEYLEHEYARFLRNKQPFAIAIADIDRFKNINDTLGHEHGDEVLRQISKAFLSKLRSEDILARWGGEEFLFILVGANEENAVKALEKIRNCLNTNPLVINGEKLEVTSSFGVCEVNQGMTLSHAVKQADKALYHAKDTGRNKVCSASSLT